MVDYLDVTREYPRTESAVKLRYLADHPDELRRLADEVEQLEREEEA